MRTEDHSISTHADILARSFSHALAGAGETLAIAIGAVVRRCWQAHVERRAIRQLERLDDRMLDDIGLRREEIPSAVHGMLTQWRSR